MTFKERAALVARCTLSGGSPFYRNVYGLEAGASALSLIDEEDWAKLPTFGKEDLVRVTLPERVFLPWRNIDAVLASSGTSGSPPVFSSWVYNNGYKYRLRYHDFKGATLSSMPTPFQQNRIVGEQGGTLIVLDPRRASASIALAAAAGVDSMLLILHHVPLIVGEMVRLGINERIRFIEIAGETPSQSLFAHMCKVFPNATITSIYGSSDVETSPIGIPCHPMTAERPLAVYHAGENTYLEVIDPQTGKILPPVDGAEGELLITADAGSNATFPLIRYRIGDMVRIIESHCLEHGSWSFEVLGRAGMDFLKVPGGILRSDEVGSALRKIGLSDRFELHRYERSTDKGLQTEVLVRVEAPAGIALEDIARKLSHTLRVSASYTYERGVTEGLYLPLRCEALSAEIKPGKTVRMFQH